MNLENYLKHADGCAYGQSKPFGWESICDTCGNIQYTHSISRQCPIYDTKNPFKLLGYSSNLFKNTDGVCTCDYASIQSRLVLLPDGLNGIILEILHDNATSVPVEGGWDNVKGIRADNFNTVAEDIVKAVKGEG